MLEYPPVVSFAAMGVASLWPAADVSERAVEVSAGLILLMFPDLIGTAVQVSPKREENFCGASAWDGGFMMFLSHWRLGWSQCGVQ